MTCLKFSQSLNTRQSLLTLQPAAVEVVRAHENIESAVLGTWKFEQETIRNSLTQMVITDEFPFKFVEGGGFKKFIYVACPCFKIPSR